MNTNIFLTRVFDTIFKKMSYAGDGYSYLTEAGVYYYNSFFEPFDNRFIPMNCVGMIDTVGNLIYADDVIERSDKRLCVVKYITEQGAFRLMIGHKSFAFQWELDLFKVVGNIHEEPKYKEIIS